MKAIITKYATTSGVKIMDVEQCNPPTMIKAKAEMFGYYHNNEWHQTKADATFDVRNRFARKRASLMKQLDILATKLDRAIDVIEKAEL